MNQKIDWIIHLVANSACDVRLDEFEETGRRVLWIIIPDAENRFPEDKNCMDTYRLQLLETDELLRKDGVAS